MSTETFIANLALSMAGVSATIQHIDERSAEAARCRPLLAPVRRQTLEAFDWNFARRRKVLALHGDAAPSGAWSFRYALPPGCLQFRRIFNPLGENADPVPFDEELNDAGTEKTILTDMENAIGIYTGDVLDLGLASTHFHTTMACLLGSFIAMPTSKNRNIKADLLMQFNQMILTASAFNANESSHKPKDPDWISGRN